MTLTLLELISNSPSLRGDNDTDHNIGQIHPYFGKYNLPAINEILHLRIGDLQMQHVEIIPAIFVNQVDNNIAQVISAISRSDAEIILVPVNMFNKHAVGFIFEKSEDGNGLTITYLDPLNKPYVAKLVMLC